MAVTIPKKLADELGWKPGDTVSVEGDLRRQKVTYYSKRLDLSHEDRRIAELGYRFIQRYRKDFEALAHR